MRRTRSEQRYSKAQVRLRELVRAHREGGVVWVDRDLLERAGMPSHSREVGFMGVALRPFDLLPPLDVEISQ